MFAILTGGQKMNIKSLLLGSAAALVAVSGARAADAVVVAEPEPVEYVRVCDVYGAGFYYIPGTETCLKISGYLRYDIGVGANGLTSVDKKHYLDSGGTVIDNDDTYYKKARFQLRTDARSETELGTLRAYAAINFQYVTNSTDFSSVDDEHSVVTTASETSVDSAYI
jgi:opacity protein-like surface antigen